MNAMTLGALFLPQAAVPLLFVIGAMMLIIGLRRLAGALILLSIVCAVAPASEPLFDSLLQALPAWVSWLVLAILAGTVAGALGLGPFLRYLLAHILGTLIADIIRFLWLLPFRAIGLVFRLITRRPE
jgi:hypothetical protein